MRAANRAGNDVSGAYIQHTFYQTRRYCAAQSNRTSPIYYAAQLLLLCPAQIDPLLPSGGGGREQ